MGLFQTKVEKSIFDELKMPDRPNLRQNASADKNTEHQPETYSRIENKLLRECLERFAQLTKNDSALFSLNTPEGKLALIHSAVQDVEVSHDSSGKLLVGSNPLARGNCSAVALVHGAIAAGPDAVLSVVNDLDSSVRETLSLLNQRGGYSPDTERAIKLRKENYELMREHIKDGTITPAEVRDLQVGLHQRLLAMNNGENEGMRQALSLINSNALDAVMPETMKKYLEATNPQLNQAMQSTGQSIYLGRLASSDELMPTLGFANHYASELTIGDKKYISGAGSLVIEGSANEQAWVTAAEKAGVALELRKKL
ncbi:MAG: hypothetical protein PHC51_14595 [bacterium]|nr:hypothetical protein [bacterium]